MINFLIFVLKILCKTIIVYNYANMNLKNKLFLIVNKYVPELSGAL